MVSGTDAYVEGEYIYQDFIYDDHGANTTNTKAPPSPAVSSKTTGDVVYPTDTDTYHNNAADLLEFRATPAEEGIAYRITFNTMSEPDIAGVAIGIDKDNDDGAGGDDWGYGLGSLGDLGLDHVLVTWGADAELDGEPTPSSVDLDRNQIEIEVSLDPGEETWRHYLVVGLFDTDAKQFKQIQNMPSSDQPGGAHGTDAPPVFNVGFRFDEPMGFINVDEENPERKADDAERSVGTRAEPIYSTGEHGQWRDHAQAKALGDRDISRFHADIDFAKLTAKTTDYHIPNSGYINRLYSSHYVLGQGTDGDRLLGAVQPYALYIPSDYDPDEPAPLTIELHGLTDTYNLLGARTPDKARQLGEERGSLILSAEGRGPGLYYHDEGELDVFEALADVASHYNIDFDQLTISGHSMGGYGSLKLASQYPDIFARTFVTSADAIALGAMEDDDYDIVGISDNLRHIPLLWWQGSNDVLVGPGTWAPYAQQMRDHGYRHELDVFSGYNHNGFHWRDNWGPAATFLDDGSVTRQPAQITYRVVPSLDNEQFGLIHDKAYWISDIDVTDGAANGLTEARSLAFGEAPPIPADYRGSGARPDPHIKRGTRWREALVDPPTRNALELDLEDITSLTVWVADAGLDPKKPISISVTSTTPVTVELASESRTITVAFDSGTSERTVSMRRR